MERVASACASGVGSVRACRPKRVSEDLQVAPLRGETAGQRPFPEKSGSGFWLLRGRVTTRLTSWRMKSARSEPFVVRRLTPSPSELAQGDGRHMAARMTRRRPDGRYQVKVTTPDGPADMNPYIPLFSATLCRPMISAFSTGSTASCARSAANAVPDRCAHARSARGQLQVLTGRPCCPAGPGSRLAARQGSQGHGSLGCANVAARPPFPCQ